MCAPRVTRHTSLRYSSSCHTRVNMCASIFFAAAMIRAFSSARSRGNVGTNTFAYCARNARCTVTTDLFVWYSNTQNDFSPGAAHYIHSHRLAAEMWITKKNNLLRKKILSCSFYLYKFRKYLSYGFPIINFSNRGVHYETPYILLTLLRPGLPSKPLHVFMFRYDLQNVTCSTVFICLYSFRAT